MGIEPSPVLLQSLAHMHSDSMCNIFSKSSLSSPHWICKSFTSGLASIYCDVDDSQNGWSLSQSPPHQTVTGIYGKPLCLNQHLPYMLKPR